MRRDELGALAGALEVLTSKVADRDEQVNARALLQAQAQARKVTIAAHSEAVAFVQESATVNTATKERAVHVVTMLKREGGRLGSPVLSALATKVEGKLSDPFDKIKGLIQELIERLLAESEAEATKKGFCDTELGKANKDRDFRMKDAKELNIELEALEIKKADLEAEIELLSDELDTLKDNLKTATSARDTEHGENVEQIKVAKEGVVAVKEAITILKVFYKNAAKAKSFIQASPVDEDTSGPGFKGNYGGNQNASKGIIGMLEVILSDFDRTVRATTASEQKAHEEFTEFDRTSKADIAGKTTKSDLDKEDLKTTDNAIESKMGDLKTAVDLLDGALERLEELKPTCVDSGMSYAKRVEKREEEMSALKNALCILDTNNVESECAI
jgi:archaellum component FlaC